MAIDNSICVVVWLVDLNVNALLVNCDREGSACYFLALRFGLHPLAWANAQILSPSASC